MTSNRLSRCTVVLSPQKSLRPLHDQRGKLFHVWARFLRKADIVPHSWPLLSVTIQESHFLLVSSPFDDALHCTFYEICTYILACITILYFCVVFCLVLWSTEFCCWCCFVCATLATACYLSSNNTTLLHTSTADMHSGTVWQCRLVYNDVTMISRVYFLSVIK